MKRILSVLLAILMIASVLSASPFTVSSAETKATEISMTSGDFSYIVSNESVTITEYSGSETTLTIPSILGGYPVKSIGDNAFLALVLGVLTGVGGGLLRDILTETQPYIFKKHVYAVAAISGAGLYYLLRFFTENTLVSGLLAILFIISVRILARKYRWELPKIQIEEEVES